MNDYLKSLTRGEFTVLAIQVFVTSFIAAAVTLLILR